MNKSDQFGVDVVELRGDDGVQVVELRRVQLVRVPPLAGNGDRLSCQQVILDAVKMQKLMPSILSENSPCRNLI